MASFPRCVIRDFDKCQYHVTPRVIVASFLCLYLKKFTKNEYKIQKISKNSLSSIMMCESKILTLENLK